MRCGVAETSAQGTKHYARRVGELRFIYTSGPRGVNTPSSEPRTKGLQSFYLQAGMIKRVCGFVGARAIANNRTRVSEICS